MTRTWQPGDVAYVNGVRAVRADHVWHTQSGILSDHNVTYIHPLAVLDPEDREQVERLEWLYVNATDRGISIADYLQAALREYADPQPIKPTDPTARVTDRRENIWRLLADGDWVCTSGPDIGEYLAWSGLMKRGPLAVEVGLMTRVYGDIRHAIGFNHIGQDTIPFYTCGWVGEPSTSGVAQTAGEVHLGDVG